MIIISIFFPWLAMLINDRLGAAAATLVLQATVIGWIPAAIWALRVTQEQKKSKVVDQ